MPRRRVGRSGCRSRARRVRRTRPYARRSPDRHPSSRGSRRTTSRSGPRRGATAAVRRRSSATPARRPGSRTDTCTGTTHSGEPSSSSVWSSAPAVEAVTVGATVGSDVDDVPVGSVVVGCTATVGFAFAWAAERDRATHESDRQQRAERAPRRHAALAQSPAAVPHLVQQGALGPGGRLSSRSSGLIADLPLRCRAPSATRRALAPRGSSRC